MNAAAAASTDSSTTKQDSMLTYFILVFAELRSGWQFQTMPPVQANLNLLLQIHLEDVPALRSQGDPWKTVPPKPSSSTWTSKVEGVAAGACSSTMHTITTVRFISTHFFGTTQYRTVDISISPFSSSDIIEGLRVKNIRKTEGLRFWSHLLSDRVILLIFVLGSTKA